MFNTDVNSEGRYKCEVSTEAPSFRTVRGEGEMRIYGKLETRSYSLKT